MDKLVRNLYRLLTGLSCVSMVAAFLIVLLGVLSRQVSFIDVQGLDAYAGYAIAAALFFALPGTLQNGDHIRVTLMLDRLPARGRAFFEWFCLIAALALTAYVAWYATRSVWISYVTHDISPAADASPLWIPQISMAVGSIGFAIAFAHALVLRARGESLIAASEAARSE
ncbi:TRAP transporter small permease [Acidovorax sp.]|jgi:TRAP-type C4-dicarboxylate transport system permease small subunit|uniref:TRAP transporter small permease n=1 Tax=Acidovorax sp. TaxID=1872122 RepID=UPI002ACEEFF0|nr:TRAP transporter small permease [Acidovorax sp.]MDZ7861992.1 TRAP transporter small permease [Acidovorax sp.]